MKAPSHRKVLASVITLSLTAFACGGEETPAPTMGRQSTTENDINALPRDQVQDGGTITWPMFAVPPNFNWNQIDGTNNDNAYIVWALMPYMFGTDASGTPMWNHDYLTADPELVTDPSQVVTYRLNPDAVWSDGTPVTWEDFLWQWRSNNGENAAYQISAANGYKDIASVERGRDDYEVIVTFGRHFADWKSLFFPLYPASTNRNVETFNTGWLKQPLVTAGPFAFDHVDRTAKTVTLVRNEHWWGARPKLDRIVFRAIDGMAWVDALANGEIDLMDIGPDANIYNRARQIDGVEIRTAGGPNFRHLTINGTSRNLQDVRVRRALAMGIDRAAIARAMLGPLGVEPEPLNNHIFMANQAGYQDNSGDVGRYDPDGARQLLDAAGWRLEGNVRMKDGRPFEINIVIPSGVATSRQEAELIQNMLGQIGVTLDIDVVPVADFFDKYVIPGEFDFTVFSWIGTPFPISSVRSIYVEPTAGPNGQLDIQQNFARVGSDQIDALLDEASAELDPARAIELANRLDGLIWEEVHSVPLYQRPELWATKVDLANAGAFGFSQPPVYADIGWER